MSLFDSPHATILSGEISSRGPGTSGAQRQRDALELEGIEVTQTPGGALKVNFGNFGWFPDSVEED